MGLESDSGIEDAWGLAPLDELEGGDRVDNLLCGGSSVRVAGVGSAERDVFPAIERRIPDGFAGCVIWCYKS
jgi:hypothetical protein